ncbi:MAG: type II toxin-antitoxin system PemK/MazF family toxin [Sporomusaceae bacterium]|jgi:mRNA-degrading endonuclease toxin of MazEF toxin-antitoxin module|nr:type II toxin-antitoxin system PemK/MazF family toxin [Sporomusaceae bacterium]
MNAPTPDPLDVALAGLKAAIKTLDPKPQQIITTWLMRWSNLLTREKGFDPAFLPYFKRGDIVYIDLGFNVGSEHGGVHYAVVYENNNGKRSKTVIVVPLSHVDNENHISKADIYLGEGVIPWTPGIKTIAKPNQIRAVSKMRILKPLLANDKVAKLKGEHLNAIDNRLKELLLKPETVSTPTTPNNRQQ